MKYPSGVRPEHANIVTYLGRIGFIAKGIVYAVMGGLCISTAQHLGDDVDGLESPMGAFIFLGLFTIGTPILVIMFIGLLFYSLWRFWEGGLGQGSDATRSPPSNFFRYRLSPIVSGCVYIAYLSYIGKLLSTSREGRMDIANNSATCFPACWGAGDVWHRMAVGVGGLAFIIAFITQVQNGFSNRWHADLMIHHCTRAEKYTMLVLGHLGFLGRAGVFMFVAVFMFRSLETEIQPQRDAFSDAINQIIGVHGGSVGLWFLGIGLILFGIFAAGNAYYKYYPTPPPSRIGFASKINTQNNNMPQNVFQRNDRNNNNNQDYGIGTRSLSTSENQLVSSPISSTAIPPSLPLPVVHKCSNNNSNNSFTQQIMTNVDNSEQENDHYSAFTPDNHTVEQSLTPPTTAATTSIVPLSVHIDSISSGNDENYHRFSGNTTVQHPAMDFTTKGSATEDESAPTDMAMVDSEESFSPEISAQDIPRPPSPFLQTRRYQWQMKRLERNSNLV
ncbi:hypothetical protein BCR42DRAFT_366410 [Absidia repens]|uniref:DUF1206 domain-containing protein n=1 Tax=Absidia repens TaxID=90262 RepID=A0A1X2IVA2_9FUNG|nr:hypothetical protein BCR42DRAFT_366410 [Absidia repens]